MLTLSMNILFVFNQIIPVIERDLADVTLLMVANALVSLQSMEPDKALITQSAYENKFFT